MAASLFTALCALSLLSQDQSPIALPAPTGPNGVGMVTRLWVDSSRVDSLMTPLAPRRIPVQIWYPAATTSGAPAPYAAGLDPSTSELAALLGRVQVHAHRDAPFAGGSAPVVLFAPGRVSAPFDYTSLAEELASHGYVFVAVVSPGHSKIFRSDGSLEPILFRSMPPTGMYPSGFDDELMPMTQLLSADLQFALGQVVAAQRQDPLLHGHLDLARIGMAGHSNGAMAGARACASDSRCRAFLGVEGTQAREVRLGGNQKPFGLLYSEATLAFDSLGIFTALRLKGESPFVLYRVKGAGHNSITDLLLVRPTLFNYPIEPQRGVAVGRAVARSFFDEFLRGLPQAADALTSLAELTVERFPAGRAPVEAELFGAGTFSTGNYELPPTFDLDGRTAWFTVSSPQYGRRRWILETRLGPKGWSAPEVASFSGQYDDADPYLSPDGKELFFLSRRPPTPGLPAKRDLDIWVMSRTGSGWGAPRNLGPTVNGSADEHYVTATRDGTLFIAAVRPDSRNLGDLYEVPRSGDGYGEPRNLGPTVNTPDTHETTPWVAPDGRYIIFAARGRSDSYGDLDLYITVRDSAGGWQKPINLGPRINSTAGELCPLVSPDGAYLYFTSTRGFLEAGAEHRFTTAELARNLVSPGNGLGDTYRIPMREVLAIAGIR